MVVVARALQVQLLAVIIGHVCHCYSLGNCRKPREIVLLIVAKENTSGLTSPSAYGAVECKLCAHGFTFEHNVVVLEIALTPTVADLNIALILGIVAFFNGGVHLFFVLCTIGKGQLHSRHRLDRPVHADGTLGIEKDDQNSTVGVMRIIIPPLIIASRAVNTGAILPKLYKISLKAHFFIMLIVVGVYCLLNFIHDAVSFAFS